MSKGLEEFGAQLEGRRTIMLRYTPGEQSLDEIVRRIQKSKYGIVDISTDESDLEDVFLQLTGGT